jgi:hypothetical protein
MSMLYGILGTIVILFSIIVFIIFIPRRSVGSYKESCNSKTQETQEIQETQESQKSQEIIETFGFNDDRGGDWELVKSGLNDCNVVVGSGDGIRDMFDFSNRFIDAQFEASNIMIVQRGKVECR